MQKWSQAQHEKYSATMAAKRKAREARHNGTITSKPTSVAEKYHDVLIYLKQAEREIMKETGGRKLKRSQLLTLLALDALVGE